MATKVKNASVSTAMHTAGLYSDMSLDGPEIGTLVVIFDRARNLPNRRSMGKQDPYCAARLGKEAKRTATDLRGGQTPKWDQELRFTVHESPDYLKLKISIFNDDRKTELVGEGWVQLDAVIVPGGGRGDLWHTLHCKGKYAGEIRLELTYYDSRPKAEQPTQPRRESLQTGSPGVAGPRQTPVKRRPLPADPSSASPSPRGGQRPLPQLADREVQTPPRPSQYQDEHIPQQSRRTAHSQYNPESVNARQSHSGDYLERTEFDDSYAVQPLDTAYRESDPFDLSLDPPRRNRHYQSPHTDHILDRQAQYSTSEARPGVLNDLQDLGYGGEYAQAPKPPASLSHSNSEPMLHGHEQHVDRLERIAMHHAHSENQVYDARQHQLQLTQRRQSDIYDDPRQFHGHTNEFGQPHNFSSMQPYVEDEAGPPPPPAHRNSAPNSISRPAQYSSYNAGDLIVAPLNITPSRRAIQGEPRQYESYSPHDIHAHSSPARPYPQDNLYDVSNQRQGEDTRAQFHADQSHFDASPMSYHDPREWQRRSLPQQRISQPLQPASINPYYTPPRRDTHPLAQQETATYEAAPSEPLLISPTNAPPPVVVKPRAISPGRSSVQQTPPGRANQYQSIPRKSISPHPESSGTDFSAPFSPDSFDELNPNARKSTSSLNSTRYNNASPYDTPGSVRGSDGLKLDQSVRESPYNAPDGEEEPIRDSNGKVVDPSDHLPVNSWAPEPERKGFSFKPQITPREREKLTGARSLGSSPASGADSRSSYAGSVVGSTTSRASMSAQEPVSLGSSLVATVGNSRNRLQKRNARPQSMVVSSSSSQVASLHGPGALAGAGNYPYVNASAHGPSKRSSYHVTYVAPSAPPVPAKIPLEVGAAQTDMDHFNEEMSKIDIGLGPGSVSAGTLVKRSRRGFGFGFT